MEKLSLPTGMSILYKKEDKYIVRLQNGRIGRIPVNKFNHMDYVTCTEKHFSWKPITRLLHPHYSESRGWCYTENYSNIQGVCSGAGSSFKEALFEPITNPIDILYVERAKLRSQLDELKSAVKSSESILGKIEYSLSIAVPEYELKTHRCKCGTLFSGFNGGNPNSGKCIKCINP